jgi:hypothetical protein
MISDLHEKGTGKGLQFTWNLSGCQFTWNLSGCTYMSDADADHGPAFHFKSDQDPYPNFLSDVDPDPTGTF